MLESCPFRPFFPVRISACNIDVPIHRHRMRTVFPAFFQSLPPAEPLIIPDVDLQNTALSGNHACSRLHVSPLGDEFDTLCRVESLPIQVSINGTARPADEYLSPASPANGLLRAFLTRVLWYHQFQYAVPISSRLTLPQLYPRYSKRFYVPPSLSQPELAAPGMSLDPRRPVLPAATRIWASSHLQRKTQCRSLYVQGQGSTAASSAPSYASGVPRRAPKQKKNPISMP